MQRGYDSRLASLLTSAEKAQITHISKIFSRDAHGEVHVRKTNDLRKNYRRQHSGLPRSFKRYGKKYALSEVVDKDGLMNYTYVPKD